jgi:Ca2+-transporting ATPase
VFLRQYADPMQVVLLVVSVGSLYPLKELGTGLALADDFNAVLGLRQEGKAAAAVASLQKMMIIKAKVRRDGQLAEIPAERLVPGDVVAIEAGDIIPADGRLLKAATLEVAESALTGESLPVSKGTDPVEGTDTPLGDRTDMVYMNTNVTRGSGEFVVTATGMATEVGHISGRRQKRAPRPADPPLDKLTCQIFSLSRLALAVSVISLVAGETSRPYSTPRLPSPSAPCRRICPQLSPQPPAERRYAGTWRTAKRLQSTETLAQPRRDPR